MTAVVARLQLVAVGASMGGVTAIESLLARLPATMPPLLVVQHTLPGFTASLASRLDMVSPFDVREARHAEPLQAGVVLVAPSHTHLVVRQYGSEPRIHLSHAPPVHSHRPSIDVLFRSLATLSGVDIVAVLLTGMGRDGAQGMLELRQAGAQTIAQDQDSSVVFGMPREAIALGAARHVSSLANLPAKIVACLGGSPPAST